MKSVGRANFSMGRVCYFLVPRFGTQIGQIIVRAAAAAVLLLSVVRSEAAPPTPAAHELTLGSYARPGLLVALPSGRSLNIRCTGEGSPTVILTAGAGDQSLTWRGIQSALSGPVRVCAWDRPGFGFSESSAGPEDVVHLTD